MVQSWKPASQIWRADGTLLHTNRPENGKSLTAIAWHPSKDILVSVGEFIAVHDGDGNITKQIAHRPDAKGFCLLFCVEWHPSGEFFVVGDYGNADFDEPPALQFWSADGGLLKEIVQKDGAELLLTPITRLGRQQQPWAKDSPDNGNRLVRVNQQGDRPTDPKLQANRFQSRHDGITSR